MKIGVLSDTHIHNIAAGTALAQRLLLGPFADVDVILHAGDHVLPELESCFYPLKWFGVCGNMDTPQSNLPLQRIIDLGGIKIGMTHGHGAPSGIERRVINSFIGDDIDVIIFGHSHQPVCRQVGSVLLFNPGSATDRRSAPYHTVGILHIDASVIGEIVRID